jgi:hypothetical protein
MSTPPPPPTSYGYLPKIMLHVNTETKAWQQAVGNLANFFWGKNQIRTLAFSSGPILGKKTNTDLL